MHVTFCGLRFAGGVRRVDVMLCRVRGCAVEEMPKFCFWLQFVLFLEPSNEVT